MAPEAPSSGSRDSPANRVCKERRRDARTKVGGKETDPAETVLDVVAVDPEKQHIAGQMQQSAVQEHRGEQVERLWHGRPKAPLEDEEIVLGQPGGDRLKPALRDRP